MKCVTRWRKHFRHLSWGVYAAGCRNPNSEVGKLIAMVIAVEKGDRKIEFKQQGVHVKHRIGFQNETFVLTYNAAAYERHFGTKPSSSAKALSIMRPKADGSGEERRWIFKYDEGSPVPSGAKLFNVWTETTVELDAEHMSRESHFYPEQAWRTFAHTISERGDVSSVKSAALCTIADEKARLVREGKIDQEEDIGDQPPADGNSGALAAAIAAAQDSQVDDESVGDARKVNKLTMATSLVRSNVMRRASSSLNLMDSSRGAATPSARSVASARSSGGGSGFD